MPTLNSHSQLGSKLPPWLLLMGLLTALGPLAIDMYLPAFPMMAADLQTSEANVERTLASYLFGTALAQLFYGPISDRFGRKPPLMFGLVLFIVASFALAFSQDIEHLTLWRIAQAFGGAAGMVMPRAVIRDQLETRDAAKALSMMMLIMGATPILAPILGSQILLFASWRSHFHIMAFCGVALLIAVTFSMRETLNPEHVSPLRPSAIFSNYKALVQHRGYFYFSTAAAFGTAGMFAYISGSPRTFISVFDVSITWFSILFGINALCLIAASQVGARLLNLFTPVQLLSMAQTTQLIIVAIGFVFTALDAINVYGMMAILMGFMACQGFVSPNASALALAEQGKRLGVASALMGTIQMLCGALAGIAMSSWQQLSALPLATLLLVCVSISWFLSRKAIQHTAQLD